MPGRIVAKPKEKIPSVWKDYCVTLEFTSPVYGGFPAAEKVLSSFIEKKIKDGAAAPIRVQRGEEGIVEVKENFTQEEKRDMMIQDALNTVPPTKEDETEQRTLVFRRIPHGPFQGAFGIVGGSIRAHVKDCARVLSSSVILRGEGEKSLNIRATNGLYVVEDWIPLIRRGRPIMESDGLDEFFVHVTNPRTGAPMSSIKQCERLDPPTSATFTLSVLAKGFGSPVVAEDELSAIFTYGAVHGYGQERSRGMGRYICQVEEITLPPKQFVTFVKPAPVEVAKIEENSNRDEP